jgi:hypothetical protein
MGFSVLLVGFAAFGLAAVIIVVVFISGGNRQDRDGE